MPGSHLTDTDESHDACCNEKHNVMEIVAVIQLIHSARSNIKGRIVCGCIFVGMATEVIA